MKRLNAYVIGLLTLMLSVGSITSCEVVEQQPLSDLTKEQFYKTRADAAAVLNACYDSMQDLVEDFFVYGEGRGDLVMDSWGMACCGRNGTDNLRMWQQIITPDNYFTGWTRWYQLINRANNVVKYVPDIRDASFTPALKGESIGQAQYIRSLAYFYLLRNFGSVPLVLEPSESSDQDFQTARTPVAEILVQLEKDLIAARNNLRAYNPGANNRVVVTVGAVNALLTEVYLWQNKYQDAYDASVAVTQSPVPYSLILTDPTNTRPNLKTSDFTKIFWTKSNSEIIFSLAFDAAQTETQRLQNMTDFARGASYQYQPSLKARNLWIAENDNVRGDGASYRGGATGDARIWKWIGVDYTTQLPNAQASDRNWIIHRLADVLLLRAEAANRLGRRQEAIELVNQIRARVGLATTPVTTASNTEEIEDAILRERALELAYEGKRWFDLVRIGQRRPSVLIESMVSALPPTQAFRTAEVRKVLIDSRSWVLPLNRFELLGNPKLVQNEYYK